MRVMLDKGAFMPTHGHDIDAGYDLLAPGRVVVPANGSVVVDTGVHIEIPAGWYGKLESKSGLNVKHGVVSLGGVIDSGYCASIMVKLYNLSDTDYVFERGHKIVQIIFQPCLYPEPHLVDEFKETERGNGGFGSTGL